MVATRSKTMVNYYGTELTSLCRLLVFSSLPLHAVYIVVAVFSQHHYRTFNVLMYHMTITIILCHIWVDEATRAVYHFTLRAAGGCIA